VAAACYHRVGLLIAEAGGQDGRTGLLATARDHSAPPTATATGALTAAAALRETVTELGMAIPGSGHFGVCETSRIYQAAWVCMLLAIAVDELSSPVEVGSYVPTVHCAQASTPAYTSPLHSNGNHLAGSPQQADRSQFTRNEFCCSTCCLQARRARSNRWRVRRRSPASPTSPCRTSCTRSSSCLRRAMCWCAARVCTRQPVHFGSF